MHVCIYIYIYIYIDIYIYIYIYLYLFICIRSAGDSLRVTHICISIFMNMYMYIHIYLSISSFCSQPLILNASSQVSKWKRCYMASDMWSLGATFFEVVFWELEDLRGWADVPHFGG